MSRSKRAVKVASYTEKDADSDDDFVSSSNNTKKNHQSIDNKKNDPSSCTTAILKRNESEPRTKKERITKAGQNQLDCDVNISKKESISVRNEIVQLKTNSSTEFPETTLTIIDYENESKTKNEVKTAEMLLTNIENYDDVTKNNTYDDGEKTHNKAKTIVKQTEMEVGVDDEQNNDNLNVEKEEVIVHKSKSKRSKKTAKKQKDAIISLVVTGTMPEIDLNAPRVSGQKADLLSTSMKTVLTATSISHNPLGFPTDKIVVHSPGVHRVGLSRKSFTKPLHPNRNPRMDLISKE